MFLSKKLYTKLYLQNITQIILILTNKLFYILQICNFHMYDYDFVCDQLVDVF